MENEKNDIKFIIIVGWILNIISLIFILVIFGIGGIIFGILLVKNKEKTHGFIMISCAVIFSVIGILFGYMTY
ncbi:hypothetical protein [Staphylococcus shinii]|uniref:hypothetical protein n=1 Tax=Staphylococcus shinii TaxID=2912228 RepID=UPI003EEF3BE7